jgi:CheY-like chemotaxis protein
MSNPGTTIVVAEDEPLVRMIVVDVLRNADYRVLEANDGIEALKVLEGSVADLLITDLQMPRMNGYQLVEAVMTRWPRLKILLVTGFAKETVPEAIAGGVIHTLQKPFDVDRLPGLVARLLDQASA